MKEIGERGVQLISTFIDKTENKEQRQALLQVVEFHQNLVSSSTLTKEELKKC